jgi:hypothetical protein
MAFRRAFQIAHNVNTIFVNSSCFTDAKFTASQPRASVTWILHKCSVISSAQVLKRTSPYCSL